MSCYFVNDLINLDRRTKEHIIKTEMKYVLLSKPNVLLSLNESLNLYLYINLFLRKYLQLNN